MQKVHVKRSNYPAAAISDVENKNWNITNNTDADVVVISAYTDDDQSVEQLYERSLKVLETTDGQMAIKAGTAATIALDAATYTIIIARADNLFPVKILALFVSGDGENFPATTVTVADADLMKKAETFQQTIMAFPTSDMTTDFATVLSNPDEQAITAFFEAYPQYGAITLDMVTAVQTYYYRYGFVWADYTADKSYYVYTSDGIQNAPLGHISITNRPVVPVTNPEVPAGFTISYTDVKGIRTMLYYTNGQFTDDVASSSPRICLQGFFILKSQLTSQETDNILIPALYGIIDDTEVFGYSKTDVFSKDAASTGVNALLYPQDTKGWLEFGALLVCVLAELAVIAIGAYVVITAIKSHLNPSPEEVRRRAREKAQEIVDRLDPALKRKLRIPDDLNTIRPELKEQVSKNLLKNSQAKMVEAFTRQMDVCKRLLEYGNTTALEQAYALAENNRESLRDFFADSFDKEYMSGLVEDIGTNAKILNDRVKVLGKKLSTANAEAITESERMADHLTTRIVENEKIRETLQEDQIPEIIEE